MCLLESFWSPSGVLLESGVLLHCLGVFPHLTCHMAGYIPHLTGCSQVASRDLESLWTVHAIAWTVHALAHYDAAVDVAHTPVACVLLK